MARKRKSPSCSSAMDYSRGLRPRLQALAKLLTWVSYPDQGMKVNLDQIRFRENHFSDCLKWVYPRATVRDCPNSCVNRVIGTPIKHYGGDGLEPIETRCVIQKKYQGCHSWRNFHPEVGTRAHYLRHEHHFLFQRLYFFELLSLTNKYCCCFLKHP